MKLEAEIRGYKATIERIRGGISDGMEDTAKELLQEAEGDAQDVLSETRRIWKREVYHGFEKDVDSYEKRVEGKLANYAPHATVVERGADYGARGPPVESLIPWVAAHFDSGTLPDSSPDGDDGEPPGGGTPERDTDVTGDDWPDESVGGTVDSPQDLEQYGAKPDWKYYAQDEGFHHGDVYVTRDVVLYNNRTGDYRSGTITNVLSQKTVEVELGDGNKISVEDAVYNNNQWAIVAGEDWHQLSGGAKDDVIATSFDRITLDENLNDIAQDDIDRVFQKYQEVVKDRDQLRNMAHGITEIYEADPSSENPNVADVPGDGNNVRIGLYNPKNQDTESRGSQHGLRTVRHEFAHAFIKTQGYDYHRAARGLSNWPDEWDMVEQWKDGGSVKWDWVNQGPENWHFDKTVSDKFPHPKTYFLSHKDDRPFSLTDLPDYDPWRNWGEYLYKSTVVEGSDDAGEPDFGMVQQAAKNILHPQHGEAEDGGSLKINWHDDSGNSTEIVVPVKSKVKEFPAGAFGDFDPDGPHLGLKVNHNGVDGVFAVTEGGTFKSDKVEFVDYAYPNDVTYPEWDVEPEGVPEDPGFYNDIDDLAAFVEGINRSFFRQALASEVFQSKEYHDMLIRRNYNATNAQENIAAFMAVLLGSHDDGVPSVQQAETLYEHHPDVLWAATQNFNIPQEFKNELEMVTGLSWGEILRELDPNFDPP